MIVHVPQVRYRRCSASGPIIAQSLIWASMIVGSAIVLQGMPVANTMLMLLLAGSTSSLLLTTAACRRTFMESGGDGESAS